MFDERYAPTCEAGTQAMQIRDYIPPTRRQRLEKQKDQLRQALVVVEKAIAALDAHPDLEAFAETLSQAGV